MIKAIENKIKRYIEEYTLIQEKDYIVVGVSGGADSMALLHFLIEHQEVYDITIAAAHIHHGIRQEADGDAKYVEEMCSLWKVPFFKHCCNIKKMAKQKGISEEEAGREERYHFFISLTNQGGKIATAHNQNDQAETMLMRFFRGSDVKGLAGIPAKRGNIIRPLLGLTRKEIEVYCEWYGIQFRSDHTNFEAIYTRNKIRLQCIPYIEENMNANIITTLARQGDLYREEEVFLEDYTQKLFKKCVKLTKNKACIDRAQIIQEKSYIQKRLIFYCLTLQSEKSKDIGLVHVNQVMELIYKQTGKKISLPYGLRASRAYHTIDIEKEIKESFLDYAYSLKEGEQVIKETGDMVAIKIVSAKTFEQSKENMYTKYIDYDKIKASLTVRARRPYDFITLSNGSKKLKKFFIDEKIPKAIRDNTPLITDGDEVIWIVGSRLNTNYYVTNTTTQIVQIQFTKS